MVMPTGVGITAFWTSVKLVAAVFLAGFVLSWSNAYAVEHVPLEQGAYRVLHKRDGQFLWQAWWNVRQEGPDTVMTEHGQGRYRSMPEPVIWDLEVRFSTEDPFDFHWSKRTVKSPTAPAVGWTVEKRYDKATGLLTMELWQLDEPRSPRAYRWNGVKELSTPETLAFIVRDRHGEAVKTFTCMLVTDEPAFYRVIAVIRRDEIITVPAGKFGCVKVELIPKLGVWGLFGRPFIPKTYLWHTMEPPHYWVKYEGLESGLHSAHVVMELEAFVPSIPGAL